MKAPAEFSRLDSLENLLGGSTEGLQFTTSIKISTQQEPVRTSQSAVPSAADPDAEQSTEPYRPLYFPMQDVAGILNSLIRLLILKLHKDHLTSFL